NDAAAAADRNPPVMAAARLFLPEERQGRSPAVVLLHGPSGVQEARDLTYARQLAAMGVAALSVDGFGPRRDMASGFIQRLLEITEAMLLADAYNGLRYLARHPGIDPDRIALVG